MDGHTKRAIKKGGQIKRSALELFNKYGANKVSIDEIAEHANVSKVTIYKYFKSKDGLYKEIVRMIFEEKLKALKDVVNSDLPFLEKLKFLIITKSGSVQYMKGALFQELIKSDLAIQEYLGSNFLDKIKQTIFAFIDYGKKEGYIDSSLTNETIYLYMEILKAGLKEKSSDIEALVSDRNTLNNLINLYFYGLIRRP